MLFGDTLVVNWDHEGPSFVVAFDKRTGDERWRVPRDEGTSWATPIVVDHDGEPQVVVSGSKRVRGYALETGAVPVGMRRAVAQRRGLAGPRRRARDRRGAATRSRRCWPSALAGSGGAICR